MRDLRTETTKPSDAEPMAKADGVAAVDRAFAILSALAERDEPIPLADIARATGFHKSTILRLLTSLELAGYAIRLPGGQYGLGGSALRLGTAYERQNPLRQHIPPILQSLVDQDTESASFHVLHGADTRICLFRVDSNHATLDRINAGSILPLDRGAAGRVIRSYSRAGFEPIPIALSRGERDPNCAGLAAAVFGPGGFVGTISLSGPNERFTIEAVRRMETLLLEAVARATSALGGVPTPV
ncbi:IclR family transcriptional regulator [Ochrobactrum sp. A-1]|uniref:IclR family transcriptional regulator n=1 Tax=Ochrobactrum sp. A-1 TaxID=2920940 RepID=UPI001F0A46E2|nr:IclR family transcriptional regulator [Ochrobactrum sp. A-1]